MGQEEFDKIFKQKLSGNNAGVFTENAWNGASSLLDQHYKKVFYKRLAAVIIPLLFISGIGAFVLMTDQPTEVNPDVAHQSSETKSTPSHSIKNSESVSSNNVHRSEAESLHTENAIQNASTATNNDLINGQTASSFEDSDASDIDHEIAAAGTQHTNNRNVAPIAPSAIPSSQSPISEPIVLNQESGKDKNLLMELMPVFQIKNIKKFSSNITSKTEELDAPTFTNAKPLIVGAEFGGVVANGLENNASVNPSIGFGALAGVNARYYFMPKTFFASGFLLNTRGGLNSEFDSKSNFVPMSQKQIVYLDIPIQIGFDATARTSVSLGLSFSPAITGFAKSQAISSISQNQFVKDGFSGFDMAGSFNLSHQLSERFDLNARLRYGLFDITDDQFFKTDAVDDRNHQFVLGFSYRIITR